MKNQKSTCWLIVLVLFSSPELAEAYIGPGLSTGFIGIILGILGAIFLGIIGFFYYPLKRLFKKLFGNSHKSQKTKIKKGE